MDKTREYLALLQKHHFWVVCGVVLLASLISWYMAESKLDREREAQKALIEQKFQAVTTVANTADHPNEKTTKEQQGIKEVVADNVFQAWEMRYKEQLKVPQWQGDLSKEFLDFIRAKEPGDFIPTRFRMEYRNFVEAEIETLFAEVNSRNLEPIEDPTNPASVAFVKRFKEAKAGRGLAPNPQEIGINWEWKGLVAWDETERDKIRQQYYWAERTPTSWQIWYANEDLWILRAVLNIIKETNMQPDGETQIQDHLVAPIKKIETLSIGQLVPPPSYFFVPPVSAGEVPTDGGEGGGEGGVPTDGGDPMAALAPPPAPGAMPGGGGEGGEAAAGPALSLDQYADALAKHMRYVDSKGMPLSYSAAEPYAEFKIMPFHMQLIMDQRKIPDFLANCANSPLPVEVRQVNITSTESPPANVGGMGGGGPMMGGMPGGGMYGGMPGGMPGGYSRGYGGEDGGMPGGMPGLGAGFSRGMPSRPSMAPAVSGAGDLGGAVEMRAVDLHVEIRGVIYIFNKPDRSKVGKPTGADGEAAAAPAETQAGG